jgi:hypothetical protein
MLSRLRGDSIPNPTRGPVHGGITSIRVHGGPGSWRAPLHASREHLPLPLASTTSPVSSTSSSPPIARFLPKSRANRRLTLAIYADEGGEEAGEQPWWWECGAGGREEEVGSREGAAGAQARSTMARQRSPCRLQGEDGVQSPRRGGFSFCVGSFGPIVVDSDLFLGTMAGFEAPGGASSIRRHGGGSGAARRCRGRSLVRGSW